ncbi:nucleoside recognition domain-containing protein [Paenibacillus caui]|uniref:nucleoside recognition domain-containing protein n=1 Tax=Paenibacillus caui TaxID=2873927 RepID=UPI001CA8F2BC|nr:nucleoside recognition domain-containing protein [Paenibacillus caui]
MNKFAERPLKQASLWNTVWLGLSAASLVICIIYDPGRAFDATLQGLSVWWHIVFPALLPFLVLTELLVAYGLVHALGTLLDPLLRRALRIPGEGGYILPLGLIAGFPAAAEAAAKLHGQGRLSAASASRLAAAAHFCNPMLLIVVIGTGFLHTPALGVLLAVIHIAAGLAAGVTGALFDHSEKNDLPLPGRSASNASLLRRTFRSMEDARRLDGRSFGKLLGDTVSSSVQTLMGVGGYILIFALVVQVISRGLPGWFPDFIIPALLEVHLGSFRIAEAGLSSPAMQAAFLGAGLGWGGLCSYFQVRAALKPAGISSRGFLFTRMMHGSYAYILTLLVWNPVTALFPNTVAAYKDQNSIHPANSGLLFPNWHQSFAMLGWQTILFVLLLGALIAFALLWRRIAHQH